jgi:chromosome segregation ATPase
MADQRGFQYVLEPIQRKCDWDMNDVAIELATVQRDMSEQGETAERLQGQFNSLASEIRQQAESGVLNLDMHRLHTRYFSALHDQLSHQRARLHALEQQREELLHRSHGLRKFADNIQQHRREALREHCRNTDERNAKVAEDLWAIRAKRSVKA